MTGPEPLPFCAVSSSMRVAPRSLLLSTACLVVACSRTPMAASPSTRPGKPRSFQVSVSGSGRPVVLIPDLQTAGSVWDTTVAHLGGGVQTHVVSIAGFAGQPPIDGPLIRRLHDDLAVYIRERALHRPVFVGLMFGATVAYWLAMTDPDLVGGVIAIDEPPSRPTGERGDAAETEKIYRSLLSATPAAFAAMSRRRSATMVADQAQGRALGDAAARSTQKAAAEAFYEMMMLDLRGGIPKIRAPVLVLLSTVHIPKSAWPDYDRMFRDQLAPIPHHEIVVIEGARHYVMFDAPGEFFRRVDTFLATLPD